MAHRHNHALLTVPEVAQHLCVTDTTVRKWIKEGKLEAVALPHGRKCTRYRVRRETLHLILGFQ